jgi:hypothetical protein
MIYENLHYLNRYNKFINALKNQIIDGCVENHHIVPRSHGGSDDASNIIKLTPRQHYIAHWMLARAYKDKMASAFWFMSNIIDKKNHKSKIKITSRMYNEARELHQYAVSQRVVSQETRLKISILHKGKKRTDETRKKMSIACTGRVASDEHRKNLSKALTGKKQSEETKLKKVVSLKKTRTQATEKLKRTLSNRTPEEKAKISKILSQAKLGYKHTEESKIKMSLSAKGKKKNRESVEKQKQTAKLNYKPKKLMRDASGKLKKILIQDIDKYLTMGYTLGRGPVSDETRKKLSESTSNIWKKRKQNEKEILCL